MQEEGKQGTSSSCPSAKHHRKHRSKKEDKIRDARVVVVGIKSDDGSSRELLTWVLAKFTSPGDRVIALHAAPNLSSLSASHLGCKPDKTCYQLEDIFSPIATLYSGFCSIKHIDLQMKIVRGSKREALVEVAESHNALRLILGMNDNQFPFRPSFSLAKYCSRHLPSTCVVLVLRHGQVLYEKAGTKIAEAHKLGDTRKQFMGSCRCDTVHQHTQENALDKEATLPSHRQKHSHSMSCSWTMRQKFIESAFHVIDPYKYIVPPKIQGLVYDTRLQSLKTSERFAVETGLVKAKSSCRNTSVSCEATNYHVTQYTVTGRCPSMHSGLDRRGVGQLQMKHGADLSKMHRESACLIVKPQNDGSMSPHGWPLLHKSFASANHYNRRMKGQRMSVVEWALQLPDRPIDLVTQKIKSLGKNHCPSSVAMEKEQNSNSSPLSVRVSMCSIDCQSAYQSHACSTIQKGRKKSVQIFEYPQLQEATNNFSGDNLVGRGGCSQVFRGVLSDGCIVAVKTLDPSAQDSEQTFHNEIEILSDLEHCHIACLIGYCSDPHHFLLVYAFASEGSLEQKLHQSMTVLPWDVRYMIAVGVAEALHYLHECCTRPVIHCDVKSSNILLVSDLRPQLTDFGLAKWSSSNSSHIICSDVKGTFGYLAPEYFMYGKVSEKTDVFSYGVVLLELITGRHPIAIVQPQGHENLVMWARSLLEEESGIKKIMDPVLEGSCNESQLRSMAHVAACCLRVSPQARPRMSMILKLFMGECKAEDLAQECATHAIIDDCDEPISGDHDIRSHLTLALLGLDDDATSQSHGVHNGTHLLRSDMLLEEYLNRRNSCSSGLN